MNGIVYFFASFSFDQRIEHSTMDKTANIITMNNSFSVHKKIETPEQRKIFEIYSQFVLLAQLFLRVFADRKYKYG